MRIRERFLVALAGAAAVAVMAYAAVRVFERVFFPELNAATLIWSERSDFLWRSLIALYCGGMSGFGGYALASRAPRASAHWLTITIGSAAIALVLQAGIAP